MSGRSEARAQPLRHDALEAHLAGVTKDDIARMRKMLVEMQPRIAPAQQAGEPRLAGLDWLAPEVLTVQLQKVEGVEEDALPAPLAPQPLEHREPVVNAKRFL